MPPVCQTVRACATAGEDTVAAAIHEAVWLRWTDSEWDAHALEAVARATSLEPPVVAVAAGQMDNEAQNLRAYVEVMIRP